MGKVWLIVGGLGRLLSERDKGGDGTGETGIWDALERLGFSDGGTERDSVLVVEVSEGFGGSGEVIEGSVGVREVHDVLGDGDIVIAVVAGLVGDGANVGNDAHEGLAGVDGVGARDDGDGFGEFGIAEGLHLGVVCGKDGIAE